MSSAIATFPFSHCLVDSDPETLGQTECGMIQGPDPLVFPHCFSTGLEIIGSIAVRVPGGISDDVEDAGPHLALSTSPSRKRCGCSSEPSASSLARRCPVPHDCLLAHLPLDGLVGSAELRGSSGSAACVSRLKLAAEACRAISSLVRQCPGSIDVYGSQR